jgi:hypothetical protein
MKNMSFLCYTLYIICPIRIVWETLRPDFFNRSNIFLSRTYLYNYDLYLGPSFLPSAIWNLINKVCVLPLRFIKCMWMLFPSVYDPLRCYWHVLGFSRNGACLWCKKLREVIFVEIV